MNICILNVDNKLASSEISDYEPVANPISVLNVNNILQYFVTKNNYKKIIDNLAKKNIDVIINLCDGAKGENRPGIEVVKYLEKNNFAYTGANKSFYEPTRTSMKLACKKANVPFPKGKIIKNIKDVTNISNMLQFPLIVKHFNSYNSVGLSKNSVVYNVLQLTKMSNFIIEKYGAALIEEYIEGREFTVLLAENKKHIPFAFEPFEILFPKGETFKHFDLKWKNHSDMKFIPVKEKQIAEKLKLYSAEMFKMMKGAGYARCDLRMNKNNEIFMLEINPNCSVFYPKNESSSADEILYNTKNGHKKFIDLILKSASYKISK